MIARIIAIFIACLVSSQLHASDLAKEQRWAEQIVDSILDGEAVWLEADGNRFLSIFTPDENHALDYGVIVMHGTGIHPNWDQVVRPLRVELTTMGWSTLSIQMPILANDAEHDDYAALYPEVVPRINAAIEYFKSRGVQSLLLVAHSQGSLMASYYLSRSGDAALKGLVAIGMPGGSKYPAMNSLLTLGKYDLPVLDLYGSEDLEQVLANIDTKRKAALSVSGREYEQIKIDGANHYFDGKNEILIATVDRWLAGHR
jgi:hypothetical protein